MPREEEKSLPSGGKDVFVQSYHRNGRLTYPMLGLLDQTATMEGMRLRLGYRQFEYNGQKCGHEFHYSTVVDPLASVTEIYTARGEKSKCCPLAGGKYCGHRMSTSIGVIITFWAIFDYA